MQFLLLLLKYYEIYGRKKNIRKMWSIVFILVLSFVYIIYVKTVSYYYNKRSQIQVKQSHIYHLNILLHPANWQFAGALYSHIHINLLVTNTKKTLGICIYITTRTACLLAGSCGPYISSSGSNDWIQWQSMLSSILCIFKWKSWNKIIRKMNMEIFWRKYLLFHWWNVNRLEIISPENEKQNRFKL